MPFGLDRSVARRPAAAGLLLALVTFASASGQPGSPQPGAAVVFRDVSREAGVTFIHVNGASPEKHFVEIMGSGGLFFDFDNDGWIDIFLVDGGSHADPKIAATARHRLYRNRRDGTFEDVTAASGIRHGEYGMGACSGDYDNDGLADLYITNFGPNVLYRNAGKGAFTDVTATARTASRAWGTSCAFLDFDRDGQLDLFVTNYVDISGDPTRFCGTTRPLRRAYCHPLNFQTSPNVLYHNDGGGVFTDVTARAGMATYRGNGLGVAVADYDDDQWPDVFVANDGVPNFLFHNSGRRRFSENALLAGVSVASDGKARAGMGAAFGDIDGDGRLDLIVTNHETEMHSLFRNSGSGMFDDATVRSGVGPATLPFVGFGAVLFDADNDGDLDLSIVNGHVIDNIAQFRSGATHAQPRLLLQNTGAGRFRDITTESGPAFSVDAVGRTLVSADIDNDGDLDLLATSNGGAAALLRNEGKNRGNALIIRLVGTASNRNGVGARVRVTAASRTQMREVTSGSSYLGQSDLRVHVGIGRAATADRVDVRWPSGQTDVLQNVAANQAITVREGGGIIHAVSLLQ